MRLVRQRGVLALAFVATVFVCWLLYSVRQQQAQDVFIQGSINTPVVYNARVMPYIIDNDGYCGVPEWLKRGVYVAEKPCDDGVVPVPYGESSWWSVMDAPSGTGHAGVQDKWRTSTVDNNTSLFMHALSECDKGSHMACLIMNVPKGPFHTVKDPLAALTGETISPYTNEDTIHVCGKTYKDCVEVPGVIIEHLFFVDFNESYSDAQFETAVREAGYFWRQMEW